MTLRVLAVLALAGCVSIPPFHGDPGTDGGAITNNVVFVTSGTLLVPATSADILTAGDALCATAATSGHLPGTFVAWLSTQTTSARDRLAGAHGFVRPDGKPFGDTITDILAGTMYYPPDLDEHGAFLSANVATGVDNDGTLGMTCDSHPNDTTWIGLSDSTTGHWSHNDDEPCSIRYHLYCFQIDRSAPLAKPAETGRLAFLSTTKFASGGGLSAADALCTTDANLPARTFRALVATEGIQPFERFGHGLQWVRPDGAVVSKTLTSLEAPITQTLDGAYIADQVFTGTDSLTATGAGHDCNNWSSVASADEGVISLSGFADIGKSIGTYLDSCTRPSRLFCLED